MIGMSFRQNGQSNAPWIRVPRESAVLKITIEQEATTTMFKVEGKLAGPWVAELEQCWRAAMNTTGGRSVKVHLRAVSFIDAAGKSLLAEMHRHGAELVAERSEEHTSELQSLRHLVCRLLLEKKKV